jgi:hypothetical protein
MFPLMSRTRKWMEAVLKAFETIVANNTLSEWILFIWLDNSTREMGFSFSRGVQEIRVWDMTDVCVW